MSIYGVIMAYGYLKWIREISQGIGGWKWECYNLHVVHMKSNNVI